MLKMVASAMNCIKTSLCSVICHQIREKILVNQYKLLMHLHRGNYN